MSVVSSLNVVAGWYILQETQVQARSELESILQVRVERKIEQSWRKAIHT